MRVAAIAYLNAEPLVRGLPWPVDRMLPSAMTAGRLHAYDLVLAPVMLALACPEWELVLDAPAIGCCGAVGSVRLEFAPGYDIASATQFALSPESQTSNQLLRVLLAMCWGRSAVILSAAMNDRDAHAQLIIGDRALQTPAGPGALDLGGVWHAWTGLPFVFACWMRRAGVTIDACALCRVRDQNLATLAEWFPQASHLHHFTTQLVYDFGPTQHQGLALFREHVGRDAKSD